MRRLFITLGMFCVCIAGVSSVSVQAMERYIAGVHYKIVAPGPSKTVVPKVVSFFSYACPHCNHLEPAVNKWRAALPANVEFERVPAQWNPYFNEMAELYYTLESLQLAELHGQAVFDEIHKKKRSLQTEGNILSFAQSLGLDRQRFQQIMASPEVEKKMRKGKGLMAQYKISGVPSFVVNGRYFVDVKLAGSPEQLFDVLDYLLTR